MSGRMQAAVFLVIALFSLFVGLGARDLWNPVEPRYAGISAEIARTGNWLVPHYDGKFYDQKPAPFFWVGALLLRGVRGEELRRFLVRLPSALGGLLMALATWALGRRLFGKGAGFWAATLLATSWLVFWSSHFCHMDTLAAAALSGAILGFLILKDEIDPARRRRGFLLAALSVSGGLLLKGPATMVFAAVFLFVCAAWERDAGWLKRTRPLAVCAVALAVGAAWFVPAALEAGGAWARSLAIDRGVFHLVDPENPDKHGPLYYVSVLWGVAAPWIFLLPPAWWAARRSPPSSPARQAWTLCTAWILSVLVVLHLGTTFRSRYLLPLFPPVFVLVGAYVHGSASRKAHQAWGERVLWAGAAVVLVAGALGVAWGRFPWQGNVDAVMTDLPSSRFLFSVPVFVLGVAGAASVLQGRGGPWGRLAIVLGLALTMTTWSEMVAPAMDRLRGYDRLVAEVQRHLTEGRRLLAVSSYHTKESTAGYWNFHVGVEPEPVDLDGKMLERLASREPLMVLVRAKDTRDHPRCVPRSFRSLCTGVGRRRLCLFLNPWPPPY